VNTPTDSVPVQRVGRFFMDPGSLDTVWKRQAGFVAGTVAAGLALGLSGLASSVPELAVLPVGLGVALAFPRRLGPGLGIAAAGFASAMVVGPLVQDGSTLSAVLSGAPVGVPALHAAQGLGATLVMGGLMPFLDDGPRDPLRHLNASLALTATAGLGTWAAAQLVNPAWIPSAASLIAGALVGLVSAQALIVLALRHRTTDRIPERDVIAQTLDEHHRGAALTAWQLDHDLQGLCPDRDSREGLGEVAAWVYRLQFTRQQLEIEYQRVGGPAVEERIAELSERAAEAQDSFTQDRLLATVQHLQRLRGHREALDAERSRASALAEFAIAFLEEARAELTLARVQPGDASPDRLPEVLDRLRTYSADRALDRETRREVATLAG
jgi:hypothetical protein